MIRRGAWPRIATPPVTLAILVSTVSGASAGGRRPDACFTAPVEAQKLARSGKLIEARDRFLECARRACPAEIAQPCSRWAEDAGRAIPSVVFVVRDAQGHDRADARVAVDGLAPVAVGGRPLEIDPGTHTFVFSLEGSPAVEAKVVLHDGEKNREVSAVFTGPAPAPPPEEATAPPLPPPSTSSGAPVLTWVAGGVGIAALAGFATFGALGVSARASDGCASAPGCSQADSSSVRDKFLAADISLGVGVVALAVATWSYLARPSGVTLDLHARPGGGVAFVGASF
jgi:hypothetical protein